MFGFTVSFMESHRDFIKHDVIELRQNYITTVILQQLKI